MSMKEYENQRDSAARFAVMSREDAAKHGLLNPVEYAVFDFGWLVVERAPGETPRIVGADGGEPEDALLVRDWQWVAPALNAAFEAGRQSK